MINGKKLNKKELKMIQGGKLDCYKPVICKDPPCEANTACSIISIGCAQIECRPQITQD